MYKEIIRPILDRLDSETWHDIARESLHLAEVSPMTLKILEQFAFERTRFTDERLRVVLRGSTGLTPGGVEFDNPLVVGAGWDKAGRAVKALWQLGFAGVEVGSVLAHPQPGNPKPRQFMLTSDVALNWLGFNSPGMKAVAKNLDRYKGSEIPIGISIGKNKAVDVKDAPEAHAVVAKRLYDYASYFAINVSSPNTPGLKKLQDKGPLTDIAQAVNQAMDEMGVRKPLFVKVAPELTYEAINDVIEVAIDNGLTGIIAANTTEDAEIKAKYGERWRNVTGGVSGNDEDYRKMATEKISHIYREAGDRLEIIGVGGIKDTGTALEKIKAGAKLLQIVTAIRGEGTTVAGRINRGLVEYMETEGIKNLSEIVGIEARK
jgi:dihydroorotate dehydrogenase